MDKTTSTETKAVSVPVLGTILRGASAGITSLRCLSCQAPLDLFQPDMEAPGQLVGFCHGCCGKCGSCHVINADDEAETVVVMMPPLSVLRAAIEVGRVA